MVRISFNTRDEKETTRVWKMLKRYLVQAESKIAKLVMSEDGQYHAGSNFQIEGSFVDIIMMCLEIRKIPTQVRILEW